MERRRYKFHSKKKKRDHRLSAVLVIIGILLLSGSAVTFSRYVLQREEGQIATAADFYFESDYLKEGGAAYTVYTGSVNIRVANHDGLNATGADISYTIGEKGSAEPRTLKGGAQSSDEYDLSGAAGETKTIFAAAASPYQKTLSASFTFQDPGESTVYRITDQGYYLVLDLYIGAKVQDITIVYGADLVPDSTNELMAGWTSGESGTLSGLSPHAHYSLVFFESTLADYPAVGEKLLEGGSIALADP